MARGGTSEVLETRGVQLDQVDVDGVAGPTAEHQRVGRERTPETPATERLPRRTLVNWRREMHGGGGF